MIKKKVCVVTGTRAEYGLFLPIMKKIQSSSCLELQIVATTMHFSEEFGNTYRQIEKDGFFINEKIENLLSSDTKSSIAKSTGLATILLSDAFSRIEPDVVLVLGDRFETHAAATTAMLMNIPIAHIHGGEITEGAIDEQIRHSITKMSNLHFTSTKEYTHRVVQMGEHPDRVHTVGAPGIDNIVNMKLLSKAGLENELGWKINKPTALFTFHSETLSIENAEEKINSILLEMRKSNVNILFTYANADNGGKIINKKIEEFSQLNNDKYKVVKNLGQLKYLSAMKHMDFIIGNSSSGIIEAASFKRPVVNIGLRQLGRLKGANVIDSTINSLCDSINLALSKDFIEMCNELKNIYGEGQAATKITHELEEFVPSSTKKFIDI
jgi:UDP-hydrolysing UDP-N-acetyl-D-glucosamine 2-epimerase